MVRRALVLTMGCGLALAGATIARYDKSSHDSVKPIVAQDIAEKVDGKESKATAVVVTLEPGQAGDPHRHPGPVFGYVLEGEYEWAIDDRPAQVLHVGDTFYEPTGCLHRVSKNPAKQGKTRVLAWVIHARDAKTIAIPEPRK